MPDLRGMTHRSPLEIPSDLRGRLETARLDRMDLSAAEIPQRHLRQLFERDADYAEALWALDQAEGRVDRLAMLRDPLTALDQLSAACAHPALEQWNAPSERR